MRSIKYLKNKFDSEKIIVVTDDKRFKDTPSFREVIFPEYKKNRDPNSPAKKLIHEVKDKLYVILKSLGIHVYHPLVQEADDIVSWICDKFSHDELTIVTADRDMLQLLRNGVKIYSPIKDKLYDVSVFEKEYEFTIDKFIHYKCIIGDTSDNISGWKGYGEVRGSKAASSFDSTFYSSLDSVKRKIYDVNYSIMNLHESYKNGKNEEVWYEKQFENNENTTVADKKLFISLVNESNLLNKYQIDDYSRSFFEVSSKTLEEYAANLMKLLQTNETK